MAFYRCGGGGIPSSLKTDMNAVLNKKFGTSSDYPPADWAPTVNLMGPLPEKTIVSSPIADFSDGADDVPTKSLVVTISPTLSGVSVITENRNGGNFIELYTRSSHNGIDYSINSDGSLHRSGTATGNSFNNGNATNYENCPYKLHAGTYTLSVDGNINNSTFVLLGIFLKSGASFTSQGVTGVGSVTFTVSEDFGAWYYSKLNNGVTVNDDVYIWLYAGSTAHDYEPYTTPTVYTASLGRTIYGGTADIVNGTGTDNTTRIQIKDRTWTITEVGSSFKVFTCNKIATKEANFNFQVEGYENAETYRNYLQDKQCGTYNTTNAMDRIVVRDDSYATVEDFLTAKGDNYIVFENTTPTDFTFTGQEVPTRLGYNAFLSDEGDTEVTYRADIDLALGGQ